MTEQPRPAPKSNPAASLPRWIVWTRRVLVAAGAAAVVNAAVGLPSNLTIPKEQRNYLRFLVLAFIVILAVVIPAVLGVGRLLQRYVSARFRAVLQGALFVSLMVVIVTLPALVGAGRAADLPSALPRNYAQGLAIALGCVWVAALVLVVARTVRRGKGKVGSP